ncbi:MAG: polysaccharide biosynthesis protein, partial [Oscillospiraceae bacterium]|nr:polysaccharide biosynthesis protein [Oscillospiraceae bacterium]
MEEAKKTNNYIKGASVLAATVAITKVIGAIYKIPLYNLLGDEGTAHFQVIYVIYNLLLTISTAGIPVALSRLISESLATKRYNQADRYYRMGFVTFILVGIAGMLVMLVLAQDLANMMGDYEVAFGVRCLAPAVLFACCVSVFRGYSQGHGNMMPTAISQIMEVSCKLVFGLTIAWILVKSGYGSATVAAGAIVGVTIGLGLAIPVLYLYIRNMKKKRLPVGERTDVPDPRLDTVKRILSIGIPIMIGSSILNIITLIDTKLVLYRLQTGAGFSYLDAKVLYGVYSKALTLFNLPNAFITPIAVSVVPFISAALATKDLRGARDVMESSMKLTNLFSLPCAVGLMVLAFPIFNVLYPSSDKSGPDLMLMLGFASFFVCSYLITNAILQASGYEKLALFTLPIGGVIKVVVNWFLVGTPDINIMGAPIGTIACYFFITIINIVFIVTKVPGRPRFMVTFLRPLVCSVAMGAAAWAVYGLSRRLIP